MKESNKLIIEYVENNGLSDKEDLVALLDDVEIPTHEELAKRYKASIVARAVATIKDDKGRRYILARRGKDDTLYANLLKCTDLTILSSIRERLIKDLKGKQRSLNSIILSINAVQLNFLNQIDKQKETNG